MVTRDAPVALGVTITAGTDFVLTPTLTLNGGGVYDLTGATVTCDIKAEGEDQIRISGHAVTLTTPASGIVTLTLLASETAKFKVPQLSDTLRTITHILDFKIIEAGGEGRRSEPLSFEVRRAVTV